MLLPQKRLRIILHKTIREKSPVTNKILLFLHFGRIKMKLQIKSSWSKTKENRSKLLHFTCSGTKQHHNPGKPALFYNIFVSPETLMRANIGLYWEIQVMDFRSVLYTELMARILLLRYNQTKVKVMTVKSLSQEGNLLPITICTGILFMFLLTWSMEVNIVEQCNYLANYLGYVKRAQTTILLEKQRKKHSMSK